MNTIHLLKTASAHMKRKLFTIALLFLSLYGNSQNKELKGIILDPRGLPCRSYYIYDRTAKTGIYTDSEGVFRIPTAENNVLIFNANTASGKYKVTDADSITVIYDQTGECLITENIAHSFLKEHGWDLSQQSDEGVGVLEDNTPGWLGEHYNLLAISSLHLLNEKDNRIYVRQGRVASHQRGAGFEINLKTSVGLNTHMALPKLQSTFVQGQADNGSLQWSGADKNEVFSWGPAVRNLEYSGAAYDYDSRGALVPAGTGNGIVAGIYGVRDFFRTGFYTDNALQILLPGLLGGYVETNASQKLNESPMRTSDLESYNFSLALKRMKLKHVKMEIGATYNISEGHLLNRGANMASVLAALYTTPATFDNSNGLSAKDAVKKTSSFTLPAGTIRSYAPNTIENPYGLLNKLPDREKTTQFTTYANLKYRENERYGLKAVLDFAYNKYTDYRKNAWFDQAILFNPDLVTIRDVETDAFRLSVAPTWQFEQTDRLILLTQYIMDYRKQHLTMSLNEPYAGSRLYHEVKYGARFSWDNELKGMIDLSNRNYFSNTIDKQGRFLPYAGMMLDFSNYVYDFCDYLRMNANIGMSLNEVPLVYDNYAVLSTGMNSAEFFKFRESQHIRSIGDQIKPEMQTQYQVGLSAGFLRNKLNIDIEYYNTTTRDYMAPIITSSGKYALDNVAKINNSSINFSAGFSDHTYGGLGYKFELHFSKPTSKVLKLNNNAAYIPVAGFSNAFTALTEDQPVGIIYGSRWLRDDYGNKIIGDNGFPLVDKRPALIGDPTPDFISSLHSAFSWKDLSLSFTFEYHHGGDRWNGTQAYLDYMGVSQHSAEQRIIKNHVFEGVNTSGQINTTPVDFYNPVSGLNRWTQYGPDGVGEDYIQDASFLRLSNIILSYDLKNIRSGLLKNLIVSVQANNVCMLTKYKGSDPTTTLYNYNTGKGLDLFNMPGVRSYVLTLKMKLNQ